MHGMKLTTTVPKDTLLTKLRANRATHAKIVEEAKVGYIEKAKKALAARMEELASGKITALHFDLVMPQDYTKEYDTVIGMIEATTQAEITLSVEEYRMFVEDEWEWLGHFLASNTLYSATGMGVARAKGML